MSIPTDKDNVKFQCERDWRKLRNIQAELQNIEPIGIHTETVIEVDSHTTGPTRNNIDTTNSRPTESDSSTLLQILHECEKRLKAELQTLREKELKTLPENADLQLLIVEQDQKKRLEHLKDTLIYSHAIRSEVIADIKQQEDVHTSLSKLNAILKKNVATVEQVVAADETERTFEFVMKEMVTKVEKVTELNKYYKDTLTKILSKYFSASRHKITEGVLGKCKNQDMNIVLSLNEIIGKLIEQSLNSPEQPYIDIDERFWPPDIEFMLRCQIVLKDPQNSHRIKLVPFHL